MSTLGHELAPHYAALRAIRKRRALEASPLWAEIGGEVTRVLDGLERGDRSGTMPSRSLRAVAWNIQRGTALPELRAALTADPELARADVLLLSEVDIGMGRSHNRNVPRELAEALGMSYAFAVSYLVLEDDHLENPDGITQHARARRQRDPVACADPACDLRRCARAARQVPVLGEAARP